MIPSLLTFSLLSILSHSAAAPAAPKQDNYYLKTITNDLYLSSSITYDGHINYVLLTNSSLAQPFTLSTGDGAINLDTSNVIGASSHAPVLLSTNEGINSVYKQVILGDEKSGNYTTGFRISADGGLTLAMEGFGGFVGCTAAKGVKQVYWFAAGEGEGEELPVTCEEIGFVRAWDLT